MSSRYDTKKEELKNYQKKYYEKNKKRIINKMKEKYREDKDKYRQRNLTNYYRKKANTDVKKPIVITVYFNRTIMI